jgi:hypothetical protein
MQVPAGSFDGSVLHVRLSDRIEHGTVVELRAAGAEQVAARIGWLGGHYHQLRCDRSLKIGRGDQIEIVAEQMAEPITGVVLDAAAKRQGPSNDLLVTLTHLWEAHSPDVGDIGDHSDDKRRPRGVG